MINESGISTCRGRPYFDFCGDIEPFPVQQFAENVAKIQELLELLENKQEEIASKVHSYSSFDTSKILKQLHAIDQDIDKYAQELSALSKALRSYTSLKTIGLGLEHLSCLELKLESIRVVNAELHSLLKDAIYLQSVKLYKTVIEKPLPCNEVHNQLDQLKTSSHSVTRVHSELFELHRSMCTTCEKIPATIQVDDILIQRLSELNLSDDEKEACTKQISAHISYYQPKKIEEHLRNALRPYSGVMGSLEEFWVQWSDPEINVCIKQMEAIAYQLQEVSLRIQICLQALYQGSIKYLPIDCCKITIEILENQLKGSREKLYGYLSSKQAYTGLHYASRLSAFIEELRSIIEHFQTDTNQKNSQTCLALKGTFRLISKLQVKSSSRLERIEALFFAARSVMTLFTLATEASFNRRIALCLVPLITQIGHYVLRTMDNSEDIWLQIVSGTYVQFEEEKEWYDLSSNLMLYIEKEVTEWLYFLPKVSNIRLDMVIYSLKNNLFMRELYASLCTKNQSFYELCNAYTYTSDLGSVILLCHLFKAVQSYSPDLFFSTESAADADSYEAALAKVKNSMLYAEHSEEIEELVLLAEKLYNKFTDS